MTVDHEKAFQKFLEDDPHLTQMIQKRAAKYKDKIIARQRPNGPWESMTWRVFGEKIEMWGTLMRTDMLLLRTE